MLLELARREEGFLKFLVGGIWVSGIRMVTFESIVLALMSETTASCLCGNFISVSVAGLPYQSQGQFFVLPSSCSGGPPKSEFGGHLQSVFTSQAVPSTFDKYITTFLFCIVISLS